MYKMIIKIQENKNGSHENQKSIPAKLPVGWAYVPENINIPASFPFVNLKTNGNIVIKMTERQAPEPEPLPSEPTLEERMNAAEEAILMLMEV